MMSHLKKNNIILDITDLMLRQDHKDVRSLMGHYWLTYKHTTDRDKIYRDHRIKIIPTAVGPEPELQRRRIELATAAAITGKR